MVRRNVRSAGSGTGKQGQSDVTRFLETYLRLYTVLPPDIR